MENERIKQILEGDFDETSEYSLKSMLADFYTRKMLTSIILTWSYGLIMTALAVFCAVRFIKATETKDLIMYAAGFICGLEQLAAIKIFAWQIMHRNNIKRELKKIELTIAEGFGRK